MGTAMFNPMMQPCYGMGMPMDPTPAWCANAASCCLMTNLQRQA